MLIAAIVVIALLAAVAVSGARVRRDDGYGAPEPDTYGAPAEAYGAPVESYGVSAPSYGAAETGLDLTTIIIPLLALLAAGSAACEYIEPSAPVLGYEFDVVACQDGVDNDRDGL
ncbi:MAG: hypothetical protein ACPGNP_05490, partial [Acidimicrobiales bacterium]